jgi:2-polyprenyl-3-methyl-5-hydroxy-6-metoxy-1,4-benzoquinol methylase
MNSKTIARINAINQNFYSLFGAEFSLTRGRIQPGVRKIMESLPMDIAILDVGCGNGEFANALQEFGFKGSYAGIDFSTPLLTDARNGEKHGKKEFYQIDLTDKSWNFHPVPELFPVITCFAVLHHIAGEQQRDGVLQNIKERLAPNGSVYISNWQFLNSEKLSRRVQPWADHGFDPSEVDANDHLIDWKSGGSGLRYVHHFSEQELTELATKHGFTIYSSNFSDGATGNLGLYQTWKIS